VGRIVKRLIPGLGLCLDVEQNQSRQVRVLAEGLARSSRLEERKGTCPGLMGSSSYLAEGVNGGLSERAPLAVDQMLRFQVLLQQTNSPVAR